MKAIRKLVIFLILIEFALFQKIFDLTKKGYITEPFEHSEDRIKSFDYEVNIKGTIDDKYIIIRTYDKEQNDLSSSLMQIYFSPSEIPSHKKYTKAGHLYHENILVLKNDIKDKFYVTVQCPNQCNGFLSIYTSDIIYLHPNDHFEFSDSEDYYIGFNKSEFNNSFLQVALFGPQSPLSEDQMVIGYYDDSKKFTQATESKPFPSVLINNNELFYIFNTSTPEYKDKKYFGVKIKGNGKDYMRFMSRHVNNSIYRIGDPAMYVLKNEKYLFNNSKECFQIKGSKFDKYYQLRIITTTALKFQVDDSKKEIMKYSSDYYFEYFEIINKICFELNETTDNSSGNTVKPKKQAFFFQIIYNANDSRYSIVEPLYEGWKYTDILYKGESRWYRSAKRSNNKTNVYIRSRNGTINAYQGICTAFPYCSNLENLNNLTKLIYAFSAFISSMKPNENYHLGSQNQYIHYVRCMEEGGCEISIEYKSPYNYIILGNNENHAKFLKYSEYDIYAFSVSKSKIILSLDIYTGDSVIEFSDPVSSTFKQFFYGASEKYIIENVQESLDIIFKVIARTSSYYVVSIKEIYPENDVSDIGESGFLLHTLEMSKKRTFNFWHNSPQKKSAQYIANFIPLNCKINVEYKNKEGNHHALVPDNLGNYEDIMQSNSDKFLSNNPQYVVEAKNFLFNKPSDNFCLFYVGASESTLEFPTLLRENVPYIRTLSVNITKAFLIWPYNYKKGDVNIKINLKNRIRINTTIRINNKTKESYELSKSALINIPDSELKKKCESLEGCEIALHIETKTDVIKLEKQYNYPIEVSLSSGQTTPTHLQKGIIRSLSFFLFLFFPFLLKFFFPSIFFQLLPLFLF